MKLSEFVIFQNKLLFMYNLLKLNLARNSLRYIIKTYNIKKLYMPYYICNSLFPAIQKEGCKIDFYHIDNNFFPEKEFKEEDFIVYPNYFGVCDNNTDVLVNKYPNMIIDNAHSFYSEPKGFACFNSARKFLPVFYGSYLWIKKIGQIPEAENKRLNIPKNETEIIKYENEFSDYEIKILDEYTQHRINSFNFENIRKENFLKYHKLFHQTNNLIIDTNNCKSPFCYPYLANSEKEADKLANDLINKGKKIYRYWQPLPKNYNEYKFFGNLVPIPLM